MKTLFIDTHSDKLTLGLIIDGDSLMFVLDGITSLSTKVMGAIDEFLGENKIDIHDLTSIVVVNGPGSFTGVRIGVTIAKVFAHELDIEIKSITSLEALGVSENEDFDLIAVEDSKGFYSALYREGKYSNFEYRKKEEFNNYVSENGYKVSYNKSIDVSKVCEYLKDVSPINSHKVNPIYIKEIDALK